jgi:transposase-like protein
MTDRRDNRPSGRPPNRFEEMLRTPEMTAAFYANMADEAHEDAPFCPVCGGEPTWLGLLGRHAHYRCRDCGITYGVECKRDGDE